MFNKNTKIFIAGHTGMVGSSIWRLFKRKGFKNLIGFTFSNLDLRNKSEVNRYIKIEKPEVIINAAAKVGGILANEKFPFDFLLDNMMIQNNLISAANTYDISKFIFLGSSCIYPKFSKQPIHEKYLLSGKLEETNQWYAIAKISGLKLVEAVNKQFARKYISLMPTNLYGPNDNFDYNSSHVLPAMIRKFHDSKISKSDVNLWGTGSPLREFLHVDDLANAVLLLLNNNPKYDLYNIGSGDELSILQLSKIVQSVVGHKGKINWNKNMKDGTPRKFLSSKRIKDEGWEPNISLKHGIEKTYSWFLENFNEE